jgi:hypothetical protein
MCFSAQASFIASGILLFIGILTSFKVKNKFQIPVALIPYFFSFQQFAEGFLWVILTNQIFLEFKSLATYTFLFFAFVFWPLWMPFALINVEKKSQRRKLLLASFAFGLLVSGYNLYNLFFYGSNAHIESHHICYNINISTIPAHLDLILYWFAAVVPFFISSVRYMRLIGISVTLALIFTYIAYLKYFTSVWCFFGAILSIFVYWIIRNMNNTAK